MSPECPLRRWSSRPSAGWSITPARAMVIAAAAAGVEAGRRGGFGLVVGLDRAGERRAALEAAGADVVLEDLSELDIGLVITHPWLLVYEGFDPAHEGHREALTTLGNGYLATRGAAPEHRAGEVHYPGTYLAGVYNSLASVVQGEETVDEHMVNIPDWLPLDVRVGDGPWWSDGGLTLRSERRTLDLKRALLSREALLEDDAGRQLRLVQRRIVSMAEPHLAALETTLTAVGWSGTLSVRSGCDTGVTNSNVPEDAQLANRHLTAVAVSSSEGGPDAAELTVQAQTSGSRIGIALTLRTRISGGAPQQPPSGAGGIPGAVTGVVSESDGGMHGHRFDLPVTDAVPVTVTKTVAVATSRDHAIASPVSAALAVLARAPLGFDALLADHEAAWSLLLAPFIIESDAPSQAQLILNLHVFHLLQTLTTHTAELDAGVPARGLHGEGYRGHVFWDELFVLPVLNSRLPAVARELIDYRWRRLGTARDAARKAGLQRRPLSLAERQRRHRADTQVPVQQALRTLGAGLLAPAAACRPGGRLQRLAVLRSDPGPGLADAARCRDCGGRRQAVRLPCRARPCGGPVPYQGRHGPRRVPHRLSGQPRRRPGRQRLHEHHGGLGVRPGGLDHAFRAGVRHGGAAGPGWASRERKSTAGHT